MRKFISWSRNGQGVGLRKINACYGDRIKLVSIRLAMTRVNKSE